jgi:sn-glycerol 3-phosphate transport system permease protein
MRHPRASAPRDERWIGRGHRPLLTPNDFDAKTLSTGMQCFTIDVESAQMWGPMMVTATMAIIPPFIAYPVARKQIIETFVNSGSKG